MAKLISKNTRLEAWIEATEYLLDVGSDLNLILDIKSPGSDGPAAAEAYKRIDQLVVGEGKYPLHTVAETIFPGWEYSKRGLKGVFKNYPLSYEIVKQMGWGTYAHRLLWRQQADGTIMRPLEQLIKKMRNERGNPGPKKACFELGMAEGSYDVPLYNTVDDGSLRMGLPCLSHLSFKLENKAVHLTAMYRSHDYRYKVPGNMLGLARLQACVAREVGVEIGSMVIHSTYAWVKGSKLPLKKLVADLRELNAQEAVR